MIFGKGVKFSTVENAKNMPMFVLIIIIYLSNEVNVLVSLQILVLDSLDLFLFFLDSRHVILVTMSIHSLLSRVLSIISDTDISPCNEVKVS